MTGMSGYVLMVVTIINDGGSLDLTERISMVENELISVWRIMGVVAVCLLIAFIVLALDNFGDRR